MNRNAAAFAGSVIVAFVVALVGAAVTGWSRASWGVLIIVITVLCAELVIDHARRRVIRLERALAGRRSRTR